MRKITRVLTLTLAIAVICASFTTLAYAKELEPCYHCNTTGEFHCKVCNNTGEVTCGGCGGAGGAKCQGDTYKGNPCDNGYYTCPNCNGDGKMRNGAGEVLDEGVCGNCNGSGKMRCVACHTVPGWNICNGCDGKGKQECQSSNCKDSKAVGWKCHYCMGAGYLLTGNPMPPPEVNDGIQNVPVNGDLIWIDGKSHVYGGESGSNGNGTTSTPSENTTQPPATTDPGSSETKPPQQNNQPGTDFPPADMTLLPEDRNSDFDIPLSNEPDRTITSSVRVEMGKMTDEEQKYYAQLPEKELAQILTNVRTIVASAEPGRSDSKTDELLNSLATQNGYGSLPEGRLFPLYFEGHQEIGFPVHVTVSVEKGLLDGGTDLYVYHIAEDGIIELLGKAEYGTYEDGTIESISFYTSSFSTFFTSAKELDTDISVVTGDSESTDAMGSTGENETPLRFWIVLFAVMTSVIAVVVVGTIVVRKKRKKE